MVRLEVRFADPALLAEPRQLRGLGPIIGPGGTFQPLPDAAKWLLSFAMLLGRLELFTVLILLVPAFWRD